MIRMERSRTDRASNPGPLLSTGTLHQQSYPNQLPVWYELNYRQCMYLMSLIEIKSFKCGKLQNWLFSRGTGKMFLFYEIYKKNRSLEVLLLEKI